jgi:hypothetical protein
VRRLKRLHAWIVARPLRRAIFVFVSVPALYLMVQLLYDSERFSAAPFRFVVIGVAAGLVGAVLAYALPEGKA